MTCSLESHDTSMNPLLPIPDNDIIGVTSQIVVSEQITVTSAAIDLYIPHSLSGDLQATVTCPSGTEVTLYNPYTNNRKGLIGTFPLTACSGESGKGVWRLRVVDLTPGNTGSLGFWSLHLSQLEPR